MRSRVVIVFLPCFFFYLYLNSLTQRLRFGDFEIAGKYYLTGIAINGRKLNEYGGRYRIVDVSSFLLGTYMHDTSEKTSEISYALFVRFGTTNVIISK